MIHAAAAAALERTPRVRLAHLPTPLEPLRRLTEHLADTASSPGRVPQLWIKRDDATGLAGGGNKTRKLEFLLGDAIAQASDVLVSVGGLQSNHARQTAAAAAACGLDCELLLQEITGAPSGSYTNNGNLLLDDLLGAHVQRLAADADLSLQLAQATERLRAAGRSPYAVPLGGSNALGALGYVVAVQELLVQCEQLAIRPTHIVMATGSAGTQAGVLAGLAAADADIEVIGVTVSRAAAKQRELVSGLLRQTCAQLGIETPSDAKVLCNDGYFAPGYGVANAAMVRSVRLLATTEAMLLDPVYTGKAMAGLIDLVEQGVFAADSLVIFLHTGGSAGLFAYPESF